MFEGGCCHDGHDQRIELLEVFVPSPAQFLARLVGGAPVSKRRNLSPKNFGGIALIVGIQGLDVLNQLVVIFVGHTGGHGGL